MLLRSGLIAISLLVSGCAPQRTLIYPHFRIQEDGPSGVKMACTVNKDDYGVDIPNDREVRACFIKRTRTIVLQAGDYDALLHELCHAEGLPAKTCGDYYN